jgi:hypothetical protein
MIIPSMRESDVNNPDELRKLAGWYREFAERAGNPVIWEARLMTARELEREANRLEEISARDRDGSRNNRGFLARP